MMKSATAWDALYAATPPPPPPQSRSASPLGRADRVDAETQARPGIAWSCQSLPSRWRAPLPCRRAQPHLPDRYIPRPRRRPAPWRYGRGREPGTNNSDRMGLRIYPCRNVRTNYVRRAQRSRKGCVERVLECPPLASKPCFLMKAGIRFWSGLRPARPRQGPQGERPPRRLFAEHRNADACGTKNWAPAFAVKRAGPQLNPTPAAGR